MRKQQCEADEHVIKKNEYFAVILEQNVDAEPVVWVTSMAAAA